MSTGDVLEDPVRTMDGHLYATRFKSYKSTIIIVICSRIIVVWVFVVIVHHNYLNYNCDNS